jgi:hypothetical protein
MPMLSRVLALLAALALLLAVRSTPAAVLLETYPASGNLWKPIAIAVPFHAMSGASIIDSITIALRGSTAPVTLGIMRDEGGLPSDRFLFNRTLSPDPDTDLALSGLDWSVPVGTPLWLAVLESAEFSTGAGYWQGNRELDQPWAFKATLDGPWSGFAQQIPAACITAADIPEPATLALLLAAALAMPASRRPWRLRKHAQPLKSSGATVLVSGAFGR